MGEEQKPWDTRKGMLGRGDTCLPYIGKSEWG